MTRPSVFPGLGCRPGAGGRGRCWLQEPDPHFPISVTSPPVGLPPPLALQLDAKEPRVEGEPNFEPRSLRATQPHSLLPVLRSASLVPSHPPLRALGGSSNMPPLPTLPPPPSPKIKLRDQHLLPLHLLRRPLLQVEGLLWGKGRVPGPLELTVLPQRGAGPCTLKVGLIVWGNSAPGPN